MTPVRMDGRSKEKVAREADRRHLTTSEFLRRAAAAMIEAELTLDEIEDARDRVRELDPDDAARTLLKALDAMEVVALDERAKPTPPVFSLGFS